MKIERQSAVLLGILSVGIAWGCNGQTSGQNKKSTAPASTAKPPAPVTSGTAPVTSGTAPTTSKSTTTAPPASRFLYSANTNDTVQQFTIDPKTGTPAMTGTPVTVASAGVWAIAAAPNGKFVYVLSIGTIDISSFAVDPATGTLTQIAGQTVTLGTSPWNLTVDPTSSFVLVSDSVDDTVTSLKVGSSGALTNANTATATMGSGLRDVVCDPSGKFCYATGFSLGNVSCFTIEAGTGKLAKVSEAMAGMGARPLAIDPMGKLVVVGNNSGKTVSVFTRDPNTGALTSAGAATTVTDSPYSVAVDAQGKHVYVGCGTASSTINQFAVDATGKLTAGAPATVASSGDWPLGLVIDASGQYAYVGNYALPSMGNPLLGDSISAFKLDGTTGAASANGPAVSAGTGSGPHGLAIVK